MGNKIAVSHFTDNKFGLSRFTRKKNIFIRSVFLTLLKQFNKTVIFGRISRPSDLISAMLAVPDTFPRLSRHMSKALGQE